VKRLLNHAIGLLTGRTEIDVKPMVRALREHPEMILLFIGVMLRLLAYARDRSYWFDEGSLAGNIVGVAPLDFAEHLKGDQLAPFGFLMVERAATWALGPSRYVTRLFPLLCGLIALVLFARLASRVLSRPAALIALLLMALSDDAIYYSSELKPYSFDVAVSLALTLAAWDTLERPVTARRAVALAIAVLVSPWLSFGSTFVVAGCGATLTLTSYRSGRHRDAMIWMTVGVLWLGSFLASYVASRNIMNPATTMYLFWDFAFLPLWRWPPGSENLTKSLGILLEIFVNPLNLVAPVWPWLGVVLPVLLVAAGSVSLARRSWPGFMILVAPFALAVIASALKRYPLHGRLILELLPAFFLVIAEGTDLVRALDRTRTELLYKLVLVLLLAYPCLSALYQAAGVRPREFNSHGDLHNNIFVAMAQSHRPARSPGTRVLDKTEYLVDAGASWSNPSEIAAAT
jgi:hypothetical protein